VLLVYRELDRALGLSAMAGDMLGDRRPARTAIMRWSGCFGNRRSAALPDMSDVNDAERLRHDPRFVGLSAARQLQGRRPRSAPNSTVTSAPVARCREERGDHRTKSVSRLVKARS
jgi:hypothetical protein